MTSYVALLRGINVGRGNRVAMADLRELLTDLGYAGVSTYLQSGNAIFASDSADPTDVADRISAAITERLGLRLACLLRDRADIARVVAHNPLGPVATDLARSFVYFLADPTTTKTLADLDAAAYSPERLVVGPREIYLWCPDGVHDSPLARNVTDKRLGTTVTARNFRTVAALLERMS